VPWLFALVVLLVLSAVYRAYAQGFSGGAFYDDYPNLTDLTGVHDLRSAFEYAVNGKGGPLGRPIALLSFALNAPSWPGAMGDFLHTNTCIHLINGLLLIWLSYRVARSFPARLPNPEWFALGVGTLWLAHPLLISASLMSVQRMTTLSATFVLGGLLTFVSGLACIGSHPSRAFWLMSLGIGLGTLLAALTKENGALLPVFALILQGVLLSDSKTTMPPWFRWWRRVFMVAPMLALLGYVALTWPHITDVYALRDFTLKERLLTQSRVLSDYVHLIFVPMRSSLGPFHDDYLISKGLLSPPSTLVFLLLWFCAIGGALALRRRFPAAAFSLLWFVAGHSIESSVFALENYFEHRNYLPAIGLLFLVVYLVWQVPVRWRNLSRAALAGYAVLFLLICDATAEVWGNHRLAAELWYQEHPGSERGAQYLAQQYALAGQPEKAQALIDQTSRSHPNNIGLALQSLQTSCGLGMEQKMLERLLDPAAGTLLRNGSASTLICEVLNKTALMVTEKQCDPVSSDAMHSIIEPIMDNPRLRHSPDIGYCLHDVQAMLYYFDGNLDMTMQHLEKAFAYRKFLNLAARMVEIPASAGLYDVALEKIRVTLEQKPKNPLVAHAWEDRMTTLRLEIEQLREQDNRQRDSGTPAK
jgi:hypothetical protein